MLVFKQLFTFLKCALPLEDNHNATVTESKDNHENHDTNIVQLKDHCETIMRLLKDSKTMKIQDSCK
jgi:hypothetical protein